MYVRILFLLFASANLIKADYSSEAKYIDLLPENEKNEFLNRIARRIISEIRSGSGTQKSSVEISDEKLNEHDAYVKKIIDEESEDMQNVRRTKDDMKSERGVDADFVELKVQPLKKDDPRDQETIENVNLSASENKIRIKKGTPETNTERSKENIDEAEDTFSTIPVHLLYNDDDNVQSTMRTIKMDNPNFTIDESLGHKKKNQTVLENIQKKDNQQITDLNNESKSNESKNQLNKVSKNVSSTNSKENNDDNFPKTQTVIYDFEPRYDDVTEYKNNTTEKSSEIVRAVRFELDEASDKWIQIPSNNVTEDHLETTSVINISKEATVKYEESTVAPIADFKIDAVTNHTSTNNVLHMSDYVLKTHNDSGGSNLQNVGTISSNKSIEHNDNVTKHYIQPVTPSNIYSTEFKSKVTTVASTTKVRSVTNKDKNEDTDIFAGPKTVLRLNQEELNKSNDQIRFNNLPYSSPPNDNSDTNRYHVFEVAHDKPPVQAKQISAGFVEAPYYVPVYNYAPNNAFYNPHNHFGPYNGNNPEVVEIEDSYNKELSYEPSNFNSGPKYERVSLGINNKKDRGQRTFKHYQNYDEYDIDGKIPYQKFPVMKGKVINIHFNPNDYLDMDYYLGRSNDNSKQPKDDVDRVKPLRFPYSQHTSGQAIDPISKKSQNMKNFLSSIRIQMNSLKMDNKSRPMRSTRNRNQKLKEKLKIVDKILTNPIFKGLNNSLVLFIPKTRTKNVGAKDTRESNIAVDYYFSRMSSGEGHSDDEIEIGQEHKMFVNEMSDLMKKHILKTDTQDAEKQAEKVVEEQQFKTPLKIDNVLKIDVAMKDNNVNVLLQKVKKPQPKGFEILLNAYLSVLKDMIDYDNKGLLNYDWLGSAVDVQSALEKIITLSNIMHGRVDVHHYDRELFRYVLFIFKTSLYSLVETEGTKKELKKPSRRRSGLGNSIRSRMVPDINILHQFEAWQEVRKYTREMRDLNIDVYDYLLKQFEVFLSDLRDNLNELHEAIKGIASVTKYNRQRWFVDLKALYLTPLDRKVSLTLLLHLTSTRLFGLIEESAENGLEEDFMAYVRTHKMEVERTREELVLVLRLLKELNRLKK